MSWASVAIVAYDAVGYKIPSFRHDIVHRHLNAQRLHREYSQISSAFNGLSLDAPLAKDGGIDRLQKAESSEESSPHSNILHAWDALVRFKDMGMSEPIETLGSESENDLVRVRDPQHAV